MALASSAFAGVADLTEGDSAGDQVLVEAGLPSATKDEDLQA